MRGPLETAGRIEILTHELEVLDAQRRGLVAELRRLGGPRVNAGSVIARVLGYLHLVSGPASTTELLDYILMERPGLNRRACAITLYRAGKRNQIVRQGGGWVLPEDAGVRRPASPGLGEGDE